LVVDKQNDLRTQVRDVLDLAASGALAIEAGPETDSGTALLQELLRWGILEKRAGRISLVEGIDVSTATEMAAFAGAIEARLTPVQMTDCPVRFMTAVARSESRDGNKNGTGTIIAGGQGLSQGAATISCIGELIERMSLLSRGRNDPRVVARDSRLPELNAGGFLKFSPCQEQRLAERYPVLGAAYRDGTIAWNQLSERQVKVVHRYTGEKAVISAFAVLMGEHHFFPNLPGFASTIGAAVWGSAKEASRRAVLELVERDAAAQFWYNRLGITSLGDGCLRQFMPKICADYLFKRRRTTRIFSVHTDFKAHVLLAVSYNQDGKAGAIGVAAGLSVADALLSAITELFQSELSLDLAARAVRTRPGSATRLPKALAYAQEKDIRSDLQLDQATPASEAELARSFETHEMDASLMAAGIDIWEFDATIPAYGFTCIKAMSPQLVDWQQRFAPGRLFDGVVERGLVARAASEEEFTARPFPF